MSCLDPSATLDLTLSGSGHKATTLEKGKGPWSATVYAYQVWSKYIEGFLRKGLMWVAIPLHAQVQPFSQINKCLKNSLKFFLHSKIIQNKFTFKALPHKMEQKTSKTSQKLTFKASEWNQLEWGCPNGGRNTPRGNQCKSPSFVRETILPNRARVYRQTDGQADRQTDGQGDSSIPP